MERTFEELLKRLKMKHYEMVMRYKASVLAGQSEAVQNEWSAQVRGGMEMLQAASLFVVEQEEAQKR